MAQQNIKRHVLLFFGFLFILLLWQNGTTYLWNQDEAAYAGFAKNMISNGNWLVPEYMWSELHRKTPFHFWMIAVSQWTFGANEFATRLPSVLFTMGTFLLTFFLGGKIWGVKRAFAACFVMASALLIPALAKIAVTDGTLLFWETLCAFSLFLILKSDNKKWIFWFWISFAISLLIKGPPIILFVGMLGLLLLIFYPNGNRIWRLRPWFFLPLALLPLFVWGYAAWQQDNGEFITWLVDWYILKRVGGNVFGQTGPPGYHLAIMFLAFLPFLAFGIRFLIRSFAFKKKDEILLAGIWLIAGWLLYEFSSSKLPSYAIAAHPAFAMGIAHFLFTTKNDTDRKWIPGFFIFQLLVVVSGLVFVLFSLSDLQSTTLKIGIIAYVVCLLFISLGIFFSWKKGIAESINWSIWYLLLIPNFIIWMWIIPGTQQYLSGPQDIADFIHRYDPSVEPSIYIGQTRGRLPALPFYLEKIGKNVQEETNESELWSAYNRDEEFAFILTQAQVEYLQSLSNNVFAQEISTYKIDNQEMVSFFVVLNY